MNKIAGPNLNGDAKQFRMWVCVKTIINCIKSVKTGGVGNEQKNGRLVLSNNGPPCILN